jgi:iron-sulfur cluster assembly protein
MSLVTITPEASVQVSNLCEQHNCYAITLDVKGGGCAGFEYEWGTAEVSEIEADDFSVECDAGVFVVRSYALVFLAGSEIDYVKSIIGQQFEIKNPNAQSACGCGVSINFNMDTIPG